MRRTRSMTLAMFVTLSALAAAQSAPVSDWPQWRGPNRDGVSTEKGLLQEWPSGGPARVWAIAGLGGGYGAVSVAGDRVFVQGLVNRNSIITVVNRADGKHLWS